MREKYPRVKHQVVIRHTRMGDYLLSDSHVLEVGEGSLQVLEKCDGSHTVEEIAQWAAEKEGEPVEDVMEAVEQFLGSLAEDGIILFREAADPFPPLYSYDRPLSVIWELTYACNQKCRYCIAQAGAPQPDELSREEVDRVVDELVELRIGLINLTGGEPLLKKETALSIARKASAHGIELELLTNAMLVTPEVAEEIHEAGIRYAQVSLDCVNPDMHDSMRGVKGAWEKAVSGINYLRDAGVEVMAAAVMTNANLDSFEETRAFLGTIADTVKMSEVVPMGRGENNALLLTPENLYRLLEKRNRVGEELTDFIFCKETCSIGTTPVIAPNGDVYPCMLTKYAELKLGNVKETSLQSIYANSPLLHELFDWNVHKNEGCRDCWARYYCGGGCRGCAYAYHGTIYRNDPYHCETRKRFARELLKRGHPVTRKALKQVLSLARHQEKGR